MPNIKDINAADWSGSVNVPGSLVVVEFWHDQCVWCKRLSPIYEELSGAYSDVVFARFNILSSDENLEVGKKLGIAGTPTIKVFCGGRETGEIVGYMEKPELKAGLDGLISKAKDCVSKSTAVK